MVLSGTCRQHSSCAAQDTISLCWLVFSLVSTGSSWLVSPQHALVPGLFLSGCRIWHFSLLICLSFLSAQLQSLRVPLDGSTSPSGVSGIPPSCVSSSALLSSPSSSRSLMKVLNRTGPCTDPWVHCYLLASNWTSCHW